MRVAIEVGAKHGTVPSPHPRGDLGAVWGRELVPRHTASHPRGRASSGNGSGVLSLLTVTRGNEERRAGPLSRWG